MIYVAAGLILGIIAGLNLNIVYNPEYIVYISLAILAMFNTIFNMLYENKSTIFTTNANFKSWGEIFQDPKIANTTLDRILRHATKEQLIGHQI